MHRIAQASLAITSELLFDKLVPTILRVVLENAGASRGAFLVNKEGTFVVEASADVSRSEASNVSVEWERRSSLAEFAEGAESIVQSAAQSPQLHVAEHGSEQVLVLPLLFRGSSSGLLYLERCTREHPIDDRQRDGARFVVRARTIDDEARRLRRHEIHVRHRERDVEAVSHLSDDREVAKGRAK